ncbi:hypothetical protein [Streptomyces sp. NPDC008240]|uniref:hypothetical protein n=1 Tax=Streptomyces sp. NPDC008240 TaxID=3364822 RepID=UPI0036EB333D
MTGERSGSWIELRDGEGNLLYQRVLHLPLRSEVEVAEGPESGRMYWRGADAPKGVFEVVVPAIPGLAVVQLFSSPPEAAHEVARQVLRVALTDIPGETGGE